MKWFSTLVLLCVMATCVSVEMQANHCANVDGVNVDCLGYDNQGRMRYELSWKFNSVRQGASFIRIFRGSARGKVFGVPFKTTRQIDTIKSYTYCDWELFTIEVSSINALGKVERCYYSKWVYLCCDGENPGQDKQVVAGEPTFVVASDVTVAPNPATDVAQITLTVPSYDPSSSVDIVDMNGVVVAHVSEAMMQGVTVVDTDLLDLPSGSYMVRMLHAEGAVVAPLRVVR